MAIDFCFFWGGPGFGFYFIFDSWFFASLLSAFPSSLLF
jgi:hypothetical protein